MISELDFDSDALGQFLKIWKLTRAGSNELFSSEFALFFREKEREKANSPSGTPRRIVRWDPARVKKLKIHQKLEKDKIYEKIKSCEAKYIILDSIGVLPSLLSDTEENRTKMIRFLHDLADLEKVIQICARPGQVWNQIETVVE